MFSVEVANSHFGLFQSTKPDLNPVTKVFPFPRSWTIHQLGVTSIPPLFNDIYKPAVKLLIPFFCSPLSVRSGSAVWLNGLIGTLKDKLFPPKDDKRTVQTRPDAEG